MKFEYVLLASTASLSLANFSYAHEGDGSMVTYATDHAPIGVMADHRHQEGEWMLSYRYMYMEMSENRIGTETVSPDEIVTNVANRFGTPATLRVVPTEMPMQMHMVGGMYGLSDKITLMAMGMYVTKDMDHITYQGMMGTTELGEFTTTTSGIGDTSIGLIYGLDDGSYEHSQMNVGLSVSIPTGAVEETDDILTPMNTTATLRLPYPMQLGSGTFDLKPSFTYFNRVGRINYGGQVSATIRLDENDEGYTLGDVFGATAWVAFEPKPWISLSGRLKAETIGQVKDDEPSVRLPVQTANPDFHGGETVEALFGVNVAIREGALMGHRFAVEAGGPLYLDLNAPQLETDFTLTLGWQKAF